MAVTSATTPRAQRRRASFDRRLAVAETPRNGRHALVWWWLSELAQLPETRQVEEFDRLRGVCEALNEERRP